MTSDELYGLHAIDIDKLEAFEETLKGYMHSYLGFTTSKKKDFNETLFNLNDEDMSSLFDILNMVPEVQSFQSYIIEKIARNFLTFPMLSSYANVRIDIPKREKFLAPGHSDEWISFNGHRKYIFWLPLFNDAYLDITFDKGVHDVTNDSYWGIKLRDENKYHWVEQKIARGNCLRFRSDLLHRSSRNFDKTIPRISLQIRLEDLNEIQKPYKRTTTQKISQHVKNKQSELLLKSKYCNE